MPQPQIGGPPPAAFESDEQAQNFYDSQWNLMRSQALAGQAFTAPEVSDYGPARSRVSPLSIPLKMIEAMMAKRAYDKYAGGQSSYYQMLNQQLGGGPPQQQGPPPTAHTAGPWGGAPPPSAGPVGPADSGAAPSPGPGSMPPGGGGQVPQPPTSTMPGSQNHPTPMNPLGLNPALASMILIRDPAKYAELQMGTPEYRNALMAAGGNAELARHLMLMKALKDGVIELRPGGEAMIPQVGPDGQVGYQSTKNPNLPPGMDFWRDSQGQPHPYEMPGVMPYYQRQAEAEKLGANRGEVHEVMRGGRETPQVGIGGIPGAPPPGQLTGAPGSVPIGGGAGGGPQYFPQGGGGGSTAGLPPGMQAEPEPGSLKARWPDMPQSRANIMPAIGGLTPRQDLDLKNERAQALTLQHQYGLEADTANQKLEYSAEMLRNLPGAFAGPGAKTTADLWNLIGRVPFVKQFIPAGTKQDTAGTYVVIKNLVNQAIQGAKATFGAKMGTLEVMLQKNEASPSIEMGMLAVLALQRQEDAKSAYMVQRAQDFNEYDSYDNNGDPTKFATAYPKRFSLQKFASDYAERNAPIYQVPKEIMNPQAIQMLKDRPELRDAAIRRYGYLPPDFRQ